jgi:hypothetical protein
MVIMQTNGGQQMTDELAPHPSAITSRAAQWVGLLMLVEAFSLIAVICLR